MNIARSLERSLRVLERTTKATFIYRGKEYPCTGSTLTRGQQATLGGWDGQYAMTLHVRKSVLPIVTADSSTIQADAEAPTADSNLPSMHPGKKVTYNRREFRIGSVREDSAGVYWLLDLVDLAKA